MKLLGVLFFLLLYQGVLYSNSPQDSEYLSCLFGDRFDKYNKEIIENAIGTECYIEESISEFSIGFLCNLSYCDDLTSASLQKDVLITKNCQMLKTIESAKSDGDFVVQGELEENPELSALNRLYERYIGGDRIKTYNSDGLLAFEYLELKSEAKTIVNVVEVKRFGEKSLIRIAESVYDNQLSNLSHYSILLRYSNSCNCMDAVWVLGTFDMYTPKIDKPK
jgi:hypothetical protein